MTAAIVYTSWHKPIGVCVALATRFVTTSYISCPSKVDIAAMHAMLKQAHLILSLYRLSRCITACQVGMFIY